MLNTQVIDLSCLVSAFLFIVCNLIDLVTKSKWSNRQHYNWQKFKDLDLDYIKKEWDQREEMKTSMSAAGITHAIALFSFCLPVIQVCWILSKGGKKRTQAHSFICMFAIGSSIVELVAQFISVGFFHASCQIARSHHLDDWNGWKSLELLHILIRGSIIWIDAFEYFALFVILILISLVVLAEHAESSKSILFGKKWAILGSIVGVISLFELTAEVLMLASWRLYKQAFTFISLFNSVIALPTWLLLLGQQLPRAQSAFENNYLDHNSTLELSAFNIIPRNVNDHDGSQTGKIRSSLRQINSADQDEYL